MKALDRISLGIILVHGVGAVLFANATARPILEARDGLVLDEDGLAASTDESNSELRRLLRSATYPHRSSRGGYTGGGMLVRRPAPKRPLSILVAPIAYSRAETFDPSGAAVIFVGDPDRAVETAPGALQRTYKLTLAEGRLALFLVQGMSLPMAARQLGISTHTVRSQSKSIFEKTGVRRQSELVRLLVQGPALLRS